MPSFDYKELFFRFKYPILGSLIGLILLGGGFLIYKSGILSSETKVEVLSNSSPNSSNSQNPQTITVEISGQVISPGVYNLANSSRINDLLIASGGLSANADRNWTDKYLNRAAKLSDGQKVYIPSVNQQSANTSANVLGGDQTVSAQNPSDSTGPININTASAQTLDSLPGIGQVYAQSIIEHRPYSTVDEILSKGAIKQSVFNKIKDLVTIY